MKSTQWSLLLIAILCSGCPSAGSQQTTQPPSSTINGRIDLGKLARRVHELINVERKKRGLSALKWDDRLAAISKDHSEDMVKSRFFSHTNPRGESPSQRGTRAGYSCRKKLPGGNVRDGLGENLFQNNLYDSVRIDTNSQGVSRKTYNWLSLEQIAVSTVQGWMNSPGHRQNILTGTYEAGGIGIAVSTDAKVYLTHKFC